MTGAGYCPQCGTQRSGSLRYCTSCGYDLEQNAAGLAVESGTRQPAPPSPRSRDGILARDWTAGNIGLVAAGVALFVSPFLPWVTASAALVGSVSRNGIEWIGPEALLLTALGGFLAAIGFQRAGGSRISPVLPFLLVVVAGALTAFYYVQASERIESIGESGVASIGTGLWLAVAGSVVGAWCTFDNVIVSSLARLRDWRKR